MLNMILLAVAAGAAVAAAVWDDLRLGEMQPWECKVCE